MYCAKGGDSCNIYRYLEWLLAVRRHCLVSMSLQQVCRLEAHFCRGELGPVCQGPHAEHGDLSIVS